VITLLDRIKKFNRREFQVKFLTPLCNWTPWLKKQKLLPWRSWTFLTKQGQRSYVENGLKEFDHPGMTERQVLMLTGIRQTLTELKNDTNNIAVALQVQDITAQKISAANHLIESIRKELLNELNYFESAKQRTDNVKPMLWKNLPVKGFWCRCFVMWNTRTSDKDRLKL